MKAKKVFTPIFKWIPASETNILKTWEKFGFVRPSKSPDYIEKWSKHRNE